jgi:hypothetical protein
MNNKISRRVGRKKLVKGFAKRLLILTIIYIVFMLSMWTTLANVFNEGVGFNWIFWLVIGLSLGLWIGLIVWVEISQIRHHHDKS